ncbi:hypothetical protein BKA93DRAFT_620753 [Sparassis latifolia]
MGALDMAAQFPLYVHYAQVPTFDVQRSTFTLTSSGHWSRSSGVSPPPGRGVSARFPKLDSALRAAHDTDGIKCAAEISFFCGLRPGPLCPARMRDAWMLQIDGSRVLRVTCAGLVSALRQTSEPNGKINASRLLGLCTATLPVGVIKIYWRRCRFKLDLLGEALC